MQRKLYFRLSFMFFLQMFILGATIPIISLYLKDYLGFSGLQCGLIVGMSAFAGISAPFISSVIADRIIKVEYLYAGSHLVSGMIMFLLAGQQSFLPFFLLYSIYTLINVPTTALANAIVLHQVPHASHDYGKVRLWGTAGWIAVGWIFSYIYLRGAGGEPVPGKLYNILVFSACSSVALGLY
ncbi:MAG TPA: MFS transporter, partial [Spirochaetota bacterium]|nr:MFS transporter [Spirochaetota bacterium]